MNSNGILDEDGYTLVLRYAGIRAQIADLAEEKEKIRAELAGILFDVDHGFFNGEQVVTVTRSRPKRFDLKAFRDDHPALHERYLREAIAEEVRLTVAKTLPEFEG